MSAPVLAILGCGLVTSVGLGAAATCAAVRARIANPVESRFIDSTGQWMAVHEVPLEDECRGVARLARMAALAIEESLSSVPRDDWPGIPLLLGLAERERPGRFQAPDERVLDEVQRSLGIRFAPASAAIAGGRASVAIALARARTLVARGEAQRVLVAAADSLLSWPTLAHYQARDRLLREGNSNGFMPGEGAGAILVGRPADGPQLLCTGLGFASEPSHIDSGEPLRADGLVAAIRAALEEARLAMHDIDLRIADVSGEQYYFKEAALALTRMLRQRKEQLELWHPAECTGETGAAAGLAMIGVACAACRKRYAPGPRILAHMANDAGQRAAVVLAFGAP